MIYMMSDSHFGHNRAVEFGRPVDYENKIIASLDGIKRGDILIHLGDFCFFQYEKWHKLFFEKCKAKAWLVKGNHDAKSDNWYLNNGWSCVAHRLDLNIFGHNLVFRHRPYSIDGALCVHGHLHATREKFVQGQALVSAEHENYRIIALRTLVSQYEKFERGLKDAEN